MRDPDSKIMTLEQAIRFREACRSEGRTVAFTNGCYDLFHAGHAASIAFARAQGDVLILGMSSDASVQANKGPKRPLVDQANRARVLTALEAVDALVMFEDREVLPVIEALRPDVIVKGADRAGEVVGQSLVEGYGGRVVLAPLVEGLSTSNLIGRVLDVYGDGG